LLIETDSFGLGLFGLAEELALLFKETLDFGIRRG
jgi:hypothetical protein